MTAFTIDVVNYQVTGALNRLIAAAINPEPALRAIGEALWVRSKRSFETSTDPWGRRWLPNAPATLMAMLERRSGSFRKRDSRSSAKGSERVMAKRPLIGESGFLSGASLSYAVSGNSVEIGSSAIYAAIQQFGGTKAQFPNLWGDIPARPFIPITASGELEPNTAIEVVAIIQEYLLSSVGS